MAGSLIRLDKKHISVEQMTMVFDRELPTGSGFLARGHDRLGVQVGPEINQCIDGEVETRDAHFPSSMRRVYYHSKRRAIAIGIAGGWGAICYELLGAIPDNISRGQIEMRWNIVPGDVRGNAIEQSQNRRMPITTTIMGTVLLSIFTSSSEPPIYILSNNENHSASYVRIPTSLEDIQLLLDQRSEAQFQWTPYEDSAIWAVISDEFFQNLNIWHVKVPLVNYAIVEMHRSDRVLQKFGFIQPIPVKLEVLDDEHKVDLRLWKTDWPRHWSEYIEM
ncbi:hypothetical protein CXB51_025084 [Gossypium anomalum]|uniref:Aminotransferase-like plant mobile domain-containing protein n=1 Tax=Gossypium anomalum TaxID=47600 RepID=A0A8J5YIF2_9ROSI|nr:hypothetical protein CXB51_025084 [Gossypium anomalum]